MEVAYIPQMVAFNIYKYYRKKRVMVVPIEDDETGRWSAALYSLSPDKESLEEVLYELGHYRNKSRLGAMEEMQFLLKKAMAVMVIMAN